jgi:putative protease
MADVQIGKVTHYFDHISVAVLALKKPLKVGETVHFLGHSTDFQQEVTSMQVEHKPIQSAKAGDDVAMKVEQKVHPNDEVFRVTGEG